MLARPDRPFTPTFIDLRYRHPDRKAGSLFGGWGVPITGNRV